MKKILEAKNLIIFNAQGHLVVDNISFALYDDEIFCLSGPFDSGVSDVINAIVFSKELGYQIVSGDIVFNDKSSSLLLYENGKLIRKSFKVFKEQTTYFSDPRQIFNPYYSVGSQIAQAIRAKMKVSFSEAKVAAIHSMQKCQINQAAELYAFKTDQIKDALLFKSMLALAIGKQAKIIFADFSLICADITVKAQFLDLLCQLKQNHGLSILMAESLDTSLQVADRLAFIDSGRIIKLLDKQDFQKVYFDQSNLVELFSESNI